MFYELLPKARAISTGLILLDTLTASSKVIPTIIFFLKLIFRPHLDPLGSRKLFPPIHIGSSLVFPFHIGSSLVPQILVIQLKTL